MESSKNLLIIGGAGFIGINAARYFADKGWKVTIFDNFSRKGTDVNIEQFKAEYGDAYTVLNGDVVKSPHLLIPLMEENDAVLHLAAQVAVTTSIVDPRNDFEQNALGTFNVLEAIRLSKKQPMMLFASTNKVYGGLEHLPVQEIDSRYEFQDETFRMYGISEREQLDFHSPYGCSKGVADQYVIDYSRIYGLKTVVFRQSCVYGKHQFGIEDQGWVAWFTIAALLNRPLTLFGTGKQVRDVLYVEDLCRLYELAIEHIETASGNAYNVGGGPANTLSLIELLDTLTNTFGLSLDPLKADPRAGDQPIFIADIRKAKKDLGWEPRVSVAAGMKEMHGWLLENKTILQKFFA
jgi:CDP-paratose 2-epimerase